MKYSTIMGPLIYFPKTQYTFTRRFSDKKRVLFSRHGRVISFVSWLFIGHGVALFVGTTSIASVYLLVANSLQVQEYVANRIGQYLSRSTGLNVTFSSAIVPNWRSGRIVFREVLVQRPPNAQALPGTAEDNFTRFRLSIERVETAISLWRWMCGRGLVEAATVQGVRGVVDRSALFPAPGWRHLPRWGDFDLEDVQVRDVLVSVDNGQRSPSYALSIYQAHLPRLRKAWLFYDLLQADSVLGLFDNSLFSYQRPQRHNEQEEELEQLRHLKIDNVKSQHYTGLRAPLWKMITRGTVDLDVFLRLDKPVASFPSNNSNNSPTGGDKLRSLLVSIFEDSLKESSLVLSEHPEESPLVDLAHKVRLFFENNRDTGSEPAPTHSQSAASYFVNTASDQLAFKASLTLRNIKASPPADAPFWMRPVAAYLNENRPWIQVNCNFSLPREDFMGAWTVHDCGLSAALAEAVWTALSEAANDRNRQLQRLKKVGLWSLYSLLKQLNDASNDSSSPSSSSSNNNFTALLFS